MSNTRNDGVHRDNNLFGCANPTVVMGNIILADSLMAGKRAA